MSREKIETENSCRAMICHTRLDSRSWQTAFMALPPHLKSRVLQYVKESDRDARIAGWWLLRTILEAFDLPNDSLRRIAYSTLGRPSIPELSGFDFNLSHSGNRVVCGAVRSGKIGVDIECIQAIDLADVRSAFDNTVWKAIAQSPDPHRRFYKEWTRLEAVAKAEGFGISGSLHSIHQMGKIACVADRRWHMSELFIDDGYSCHVATEHPLSILEIREFSATKI